MEEQIYEGWVRNDLILKMKKNLRGRKFLKKNMAPSHTKIKIILKIFLNRKRGEK